MVKCKTKHYCLYQCIHKSKY